MDFYHLEDFLGQTLKPNMITNKIKKQIIEHSRKVYPEECCGFIVEKNEEKICIPCENIAKNKIENFLISSRDFISIKNKYDRVLFLYHNHINEKEFSILDKKTANILAIDLLLYINEINAFKVYYNDEFKNLNYLFKEYDDYQNNCFHLIKNYFKYELNIDINFDEDFLYGKRIEDLNVFEIVLNNYEKNNFKFISNSIELRKNDILILKDKISSHLAVYLGGNKILHQPINKISLIEDYSDKYKKETKGLFRSNILYGKD